MLNKIGKEILYTDRETILNDVRDNGYRLGFASDELRNDREIVLERVKSNGYRYKFASESLQSDKHIILESLKKYEFHFETLPVELLNQYGTNIDEFIKNLDKELNGVKKFKIRNFKNDPEILELISEIKNGITHDNNKDKQKRYTYNREW